jgi:hypothetical protein
VIVHHSSILLRYLPARRCQAKLTAMNSRTVARQLNVRFIAWVKYACGLEREFPRSFRYAGLGTAVLPTRRVAMKGGVRAASKGRPD